MSENMNSGALPTLDVSEVLGAPEARAKSKTNVGRFMILVFIVSALVFVMLGLLLFQKYREKRIEPVTATKALEKPAFETKNVALEDASIESHKAELKKQEEIEQARIKALEAAQAAAAEEAERARLAAEEKRRGLAKPMAEPEFSGASQAGPATKASGVLLELNGSKPKADGSGGTGGYSDKSQRERTQLDFKERMAIINGASGGAGKSGAGGSLGGSTGGGGETLGGRLQPTTLQARSAARLSNLDYLLKRGTSIPCALKTGINTTLPGFVICNVLNDVYSANSKTLLIERGATVFGEQQSALKQGQERTFVLWTRVDNPSGVFADIDSPATDQMGYSGVPGYVDTHFWARFGGAIMLSLINDYSAALAQRTAGKGDGSMNYNNTQQTSQDMATEALRSSINIPPTLEVLPGTVVNVLVARDVSFESVYANIR